MDKSSMSERDICTKFILPAIKDAGWDIITQIREEVTYTKGQISVRGKLVARGKTKRADFILNYKENIPIAIIEAKDNNHEVGDGIQQAIDYANDLKIPFAFSSNGDGFVFHDLTGNSPVPEIDLTMNSFPSPSDLWKKYCKYKHFNQSQAISFLQPYHSSGSGKGPRYYQVNAINSVMEAIAKGQKRQLLVMATGTGKTYTAFQIIWRLWKSRQKKRILFLADRNILVDQTMVNDFRPFGEVMAKLSTRSKTIEKDNGKTEDLITAIGKNRKVDTSYEVYLSLYQSITGPEEKKKLFKGFSRDFFDLIVIDECHRGSAAEDSAWREILEYFCNATQIGMTATPKETEYVSNIEYFGNPVYTYSLKQGIEDGFLAPYKVIKYHIDKDVEGYQPLEGDTDRYGNEIENRIYNTKDFDRTLVLDERTKLVAKKVSDYLKESGNPYQKSIIFCVDQEHASRMRQALINENPSLVKENSRYVMRITGDDKIGQDQLDNFIDPESKYPVLVTTSRLLSTGVDAQTCRLIVLDREVGSVSEFKQILGRGTRIHEETQKYYFTLMDFRGATNHFFNPDFDGEPIQIYNPGPDDPIDPIDPGSDDNDDGGEDILINPINPVNPRKKKIYVDGVSTTIIAERIEYLDSEGKLVTESLKDYTKRTLNKKFSSLDEFIRRWDKSKRKQTLLDEIEREGLPLELIANEINKDIDPFDLVCSVAFDKKPLTRKERAENVKKRDVFSKYNERARAVLDALLNKYADEGFLNLDDTNVLRISPLNEIGTPLELLMSFGGKDQYEEAIFNLQSELYKKTG